MDADSPLDLRRILEPVAPRTFHEAHWGRAPLHIRGPRDKFAPLLDRAGFERLVVDAARREFPPGGPAPLLMAAYPDLRHKVREIIACRISPAQLEPMLALGSTMFIGNLYLLDERLARFRSALTRQLALQPDHANLTCFLSPAGSGLVGHAAPEHLLAMQLQGSKRWRFSTRPRPDVTGENYERPQEADLSEAVLEPGDALYLPPGTWHEAMALEESLHLSVHAEETSFLALFSRFLTELAHSGHLTPRHIPAGFIDIGDGAPPAVVSEALEAGWRELREVLESVDMDDLSAAWRRALGRKPS